MSEPVPTETWYVDLQEVRNRTIAIEIPVGLDPAAREAEARERWADRGVPVNSETTGELVIRVSPAAEPGV